MASAGAQNPQNSAFENIERRATEARQAKNFEEAVTLYRDGLKLRPDWNEGDWYLGTSLFGLKRYEEARGAFLELAGLQPSNGQAWALAGMCEFELKDAVPALEHLSRSESVGLGSNDELSALVGFRIALLLNRTGKSKEAIRRLIPIALAADSQEVIEALGLSTLRDPLLPAEIPEPEHDLYTKAGKATREYVKHDSAEAAKSFEKLVSAYPDRPSVHYAYGLFLLETNPERALLEFERELDVNPSHLDALSELAKLYLKQAAFEKALPYARRAVQVNPDIAKSHSLLGESMLGSGITAEAIQEFESAVKLAPDNPQTRFLLANAYKQAGNQALASKQMAEFQRLDAIQKAPETVGTPDQ